MARTAVLSMNLKMIGATQNVSTAAVMLNVMEEHNTVSDYKYTKSGLGQPLLY